jgi:uncharacterized membrane protein
MATATQKIKRIIPWRFALFFALLLGGWAWASFRFDAAQSLLIAFDVASVAFLAANASSLNYDAQRLRNAAAENDANRAVLLIVSVTLTIVILAALAGELAKGHLSGWDKALVTATLVLVWTFGNAVYTLHYVHLYYSSKAGKDCAGLEFPKLKEPLMADFAYFAFTLGVAVQTSDVVITSREIRKVVTIHCVAGFFFNLGVLALAINILGSS